MTGTASGEETAAMTPELNEGDFGRTAETPSGKGAGDENFPVGSWLLPARLRPHVAKFYAFARAIDDIADNPKLTPEDKIRRLDRFEDAITGRKTEDPALVTAHRLRASLAETGVTAQHCVDLVAAFKQDAVRRSVEGRARRDACPGHRAGIGMSPKLRAHGSELHGPPKPR
jgi:hypothetical protein